MPPYDLFLHLKLLEAMPRSGPQRRRITEFLRRLCEHPETPEDFTSRDASRERRIKIVADHAVTYWVDDAVRAVMVVDIRPAGR